MATRYASELLTSTPLTIQRIANATIQEVSCAGRRNMFATWLRDWDGKSLLRHSAEKGAAEILKPVVSAAQFLSAFALLRAPQMPVIIDDVASALLVVVQLAVAGIAASGYAVGFQIVALDLNVRAALRIRASRRVRGNSGDAERSGHAAQRAILIHDLPVALSVVVEAGVLPVAIHVLAARLEVVTVALDVLARLRVRRSHHANRSAINAGRIARSVCAAHAAQFAVLICHVAAALLVIVELGVVPVSIRGLAARLQVVAIDAHVLTCLCIRSIGNSCLITRLITCHRCAPVASAT